MLFRSPRRRLISSISFAEIQKALQTPAVREKLAKLGVQPMAMNAGAFDKFVNEELAINADLAKAAGISAH